MAASVLKTLWHYSPDGTKPRKINGPIAASQGILIPSAPLYLSQSGTWKVCDSSDASDAWHGFFSGMRDKSLAWPITAELAADTQIRITPIRSSDLWTVFAETGDADTTLAQTNVGDQYGLTVATGAGKVGYTTMALDNANATVQVQNLMANLEASKYALTDSPSAGVVSFLDSVIQAVKA